MKKLYKILGYISITLSIGFLTIFQLISLQLPDEPFARDIFGLQIPDPSNGLLGGIFSLHGVVSLSVPAILFGIGSLFLNWSAKFSSKNN